MLAAERRKQGTLISRPGHPDEFAVLAPDRTVALWNASQSRRIATLQTSIDPRAAGWDLAFDQDGSRAVILNGGMIELWDIASSRLVLPPIAAPQADKVLGFTRDGYLMTTGSVFGEVVEFWDLTRGGSAGTLKFDFGQGVEQPYDVAVDAVPVGSDGTMPFMLPVDARAWVDHLCRVGGRRFTDKERGALPRGTPAEIAC